MANPLAEALTSYKRPGGDEQAAALGDAAGKPKTITDDELAAQLRTLAPGEQVAFKQAFKSSMEAEMPGFVQGGQITDPGFMDKVNRRIMTALGPKEGPHYEASLHLGNLERVAGQRIHPAHRQALVVMAIGHPERMQRLHRHVARKASARA